MKTRNSHGLLQLGREALAYCQCASALISGNKALFVSVDLIGEKNQVILELIIIGFFFVVNVRTFILFWAVSLLTILLRHHTKVGHVRFHCYCVDDQCVATRRCGRSYVYTSKKIL